MDTAMRDLDRIEERSSNDGRRILVLSGVGLVAALAIVIAAIAALPEEGESLERDPLRALAVSQGEPSEPLEAPADPEIDPETLSFPTTLVTERRPEVGAALAAAAAELEHLDPLTDPRPRSDIAAGLPAAVTAGPDGEVVELSAAIDPLVAGTVRAQPPAAPAGREGLYTLQVVSYADPQEAQIFASALRKRGHAAYVTAGVVEGRGTHWRVRIGPFDTQQEAQSYRTIFEREEGMNTFVVRNK